MAPDPEDARNRFEAMAGLLGGVPEAVETLAERDREEFGEEYLLAPHDDGVPVISNVHRLRFMVEQCGLTYDESLAAMVAWFPITTDEEAQNMPDPAAWAVAVLNSHGNFAEALLDLEIVRAQAAGHPGARSIAEASIAALKQMRIAPAYEGREWDEA